ARGGYHRYLGWTVSLLPVPRDWRRAASILAPLTKSALEGKAPDNAELVRATLDAFKLGPHCVESLLEWNAR
ncbi:MAG: hypothetical protein ACRD3J_24775, partial [Thermoanaerobaculia bacterium]